MDQADRAQPNTETKPFFTKLNLRDLRIRTKLKLVYVRALGLKRASYKDVWNTVSTDHALAMIGVSGAAEEEEFFRTGVTTAESLREMMQIEPQHTVLEIGCGVGRIGRHLSTLCAKWIGTDISSKMLGFARTNLAARPNVELIELATSTLNEISSDSLDRVYSTAVFMHLDEWDRYQYVTEAFRVLKPGGWCYFDNINLAGDVGWSIFLEMTKYEPSLRPPNISKASTAEELATYLRRAGFADIREYPGSHFVAVTGRKPEQ